MARLLPTEGSPFPLDPKTPITIGSSGDATLRLTDPAVAELHCVLRALQDGGFGLKDLGSATGTRVNGRQVRAVRLKHGDRIQVGSQEIVFESPEAAPSDNPAASKPAASKPAARKADVSKADVRKASANKPVADEPPADARSKSPPQNGDPLLTGRVKITGYEVHSLLGSGGMGRVYEATQLSLHRKVALKILNPKLAKDPSFVESFLLEARASARFNHPNVVQVFDVDEADGRPFYSMELLTGSLEERLHKEGRLPTEEAIGVIHDAAMGLAYANQLSLVHRDVKPDNLMMDKEGRTKLCDLGLAASIERSHEGKVAGTPHFMSPEQIRKAPLDQRSDLYSLGCTFWRLLTGKNVFGGKTVRDILKAQLESPPPKLREVLPEASEELEGILAKLLAKDPEERYAQASDLAEDLQVLVGGKHKSHRGLAFALGGLVLVMAVVVGVLLNQGPEKEIQVITETDPDSARQQAELRESNAEVALLKVPAQGSLSERALAYEKVHKEHPGTKAGQKAREQATLLRQEQKRLAAAAAARKLRDEKLALAVEQAGVEDRRAGRLEIAWRKTVLAAGDRPRPRKADLALDQVRAGLLQDLKQHVQDSLTQLREALAETDADPVQLRENFQESLRPRRAEPQGEDLAWTLPGAKDLLDSARKTGADEIRKVVVARALAKRAEMQRLLVQRRELLLGKGAGLELLAQLRFLEASRFLREFQPPASMKERWQGILDLAEIAGDADGALSALLLIKDGEGKPRTLDYQGGTARVLSFDGKTLVLELGRGRRRKRQEAKPWQEAALLEQILSPSQKLSEDLEKKRQALILILNLLDLLPQAQSLVHGSANGGPPEELPLDRGRMALLPEGRFLSKAMAREGEAVRLLAQLLRAWNAKADLQAMDALRRLERAHRTSAIGIALGIPVQGPKRDGQR